MTLTEREKDLLCSGLHKPTPVFREDYEIAVGLSQRGLAILSGVRAFKLKTTPEGVAAMSADRNRKRAWESFTGLTASECNAWLATLPPVPLYGEE